MPLMRDEVIAALVAGVAGVSGRVYEVGAADPNEVRPYLVVELGAEDAGNPWLAYGDPITTTIYGEPTTFATLDTIEAQVKTALTNLVVLDDEAGPNVRYLLLYVGSASPDDVDSARRPRSLVRSVQHVAFSLALLDSHTYNPDPAQALIDWTRERWAEIQGVWITGHPTAGTWTLQYPAGATTGPIPYNATAAQVQAALEALPQIGAGGVVVTAPGGLPGGGNVGYAGGPYTVKFTGSQAPKDHPALVANPALLTGPAPPTSGVTVTTLRQGVAVQTDPATWAPTAASPILYWRYERTTGGRRDNAHVWHQAVYRAHIINPDFAKRTEWTRRVAEALIEAEVVTMANAAIDVVLEHVTADNRLHPVNEGQIAVALLWKVRRVDTDPPEATVDQETAILSMTGPGAPVGGPAYPITIHPEV